MIKNYRLFNNFYLHSRVNTTNKTNMNIHSYVIHTGDFMKKVLIATWALRDRYIVAIE